MTATASWTTGGGWYFVGRDNTPTDENGHGTHVSGTIAASGNNGAGITGVAWNSRVLPLRVLDANGSGTVADLISAYRYAAARGIRVVNVSITGSGYSAAERDAIQSAANTLFVVAAGNGGSDGVGDNVDGAGQYPRAYPSSNVVCVAASDQQDGRAGFSNYGPGSVDIAAPGVRQAPQHLMDGAYSYLDGTSMATPHVSATASPMSATRGRPAARRTPGRPHRRCRREARVCRGPRSPVAASTRLASLRMAGYAPARPGAAVAAPAPAPARAVKKRTPVRVSLKLLSKKQLRTLLKRGLKVRTGCSERCRITVNSTPGSADRSATQARAVEQDDRTRQGRRDGALEDGDGAPHKARQASACPLVKTARLVIEASAVNVAGTGNRRALSASFRASSPPRRGHQPLPPTRLAL